MTILYFLLAALAILILVVLVRAAMFTPKPPLSADTTPETIDTKAATQNLSAMIKLKTVYNGTDYSEHNRFHELLNTLYPHIAAKCECKRFGETAVLYKWAGKNSAAPTVLMSHYDVVPANQEQWSADAFGAVLKDNKIYGRGTLDTKSTLCSVMEASNKLIAEGFIPENDIYMAFSGDEEVAGNGQPTIVEYFKQNNIVPALVLDEGGAVVAGMFPGVAKQAALIGISEKGQVSIKLNIKSNGGHASSPPKITPVTELAKAITAIEKHPFKFRLNIATSTMFNNLGRHSTFIFKMIFANMWLFAPLLDLFGKSTGGSINALLRTTCAFTVMEGSSANNVIPPKASVTVNIRIINGETIDTVKQHLKNVIKNDNIELEVLEGSNPCNISSLDSEGWNKLAHTVQSCWPSAIVSPYLMYAASDSRHYATISNNVYRFSVIEMSKEQLGTIHGNDEHITVEQLTKMVEFYIKLIKKC